MTQGGQTGSHRQLVAAEGAGVVTRFPGVELFFNAQHRQRQTATDRFRHHDDVRLDTGVLEGEEFTGTGKASLHFIDDQQNAMLFGHFADALQPLNRRRVHAAFTLHGFEDHRRRFTDAALHVVDQVFEVVGQGFHAGFAADAQRATIQVRVRHELDFRHHAVNRRFRRQVASDGQRAMGHPVIAAGEADHRRTASVFFRQFQRGFHGVSAGRTGELQAILFPFARQAREQVFGETIF